MKDSGKRVVIGLLSTKRKIKTAPILNGVINAWAFLSFAQTKNRRPEEDGEKAH